MLREFLAYEEFVAGQNGFSAFMGELNGLDEDQIPIICC